MKNISIKELELSTRTRNALLRAGIFNLNELLELSVEELFNLKSMGAKSVEEVINLQKAFWNKNGDSVVFTEEIVDNNQDCGEKFSIPDSVNTKATILYNQTMDVQSTKNRLIDIALENSVSGDAIGKIYYLRGSSKYVEDIPINELNFSLRTTNTLLKNGYETINQVALENYQTIEQLRSMGKKSISELIDFLRKNAKWVEQKELVDTTIEEIFKYFCEMIKGTNKELPNSVLDVVKICLFENRDEIKLLYVGCDFKTLVEKKQFKEIILNSEDLKTLYKAYIFSKMPFTKSEELKKEDYFCRNGLLDKVLVELQDSNEIEEIDGIYQVKMTTIQDWIDSIKKETPAKMLKMRIAGKTLEACGQEMGVTRERVRQVVAKLIRQKPTLREDVYAYWFEKYEFDKNSFTLIFNEPEQVYNYLNMVYKKGKNSVDDILDDEKMTKKIFIAANNYVNRNNVYIDGEYISCSRNELLKRIAQKECDVTDISYDMLYEKYMEFLKCEDLIENDQLLFPSLRAFEGRMDSSMYLLLKYGRKCRYYPIQEIDIEEFVQQLNLGQFTDVEISAKKIIDDNKDVMEEYDIHDEYELHNLFKKTESVWNKDNKYNVVLKRMPFMAFGNVDRKKQVEDLMLQLAPISIEEYCEWYEMEYGVLSATVAANFIPYIYKYLHHGTYSVEQPVFNDEEYTYMSNALTNDFYFVDDIKKIYSDRFGKDTINKINSRTLKELGFRPYVNYVVSFKYNSTHQYFHEFLSKEDILDFKNDVNKRLSYIQMVSSVLDELRSSYELLEFEDMKFIKFSRVKSVYPDFSEELIKDFVDKAIEYIKDEKYFTVRSLHNKGFTHKIDAIQLGEWFKVGLIKNSKKVRYIKTGGSAIFYTGEKRITTLDFLKHLMKKIVKINIYDLAKYINDEYGVDLKKEKIVELIKPSNLYYDSVMEKIYLSKEYYYDEI
ncbi:MAG: hypothetical protein KH047_00120 [Eubacterium sp.]|nr:hypothetical protein [Eubacterium sp.]